MNTRDWDDLVNSVRKQIDDLRTTLNQNEKAASAQTETLDEARKKVEELLESPANPREMFYQLPLTLQSLTTQKLVGVFLIAGDGRVVLHHGSGPRLLSIDPLSNKLPSGCLYDKDGQVILEENLPWSRCLRGEDCEGSIHLILKDEHSAEPLHLDITAVPLRNDNDVSGVVVLFRDKTENIKASHYIRELCNSLEKQLSSIESAQRELKLFSEKLLELTGSRPAAESPDEAKPAPMPPGRKVLIVDDIPVNQRLLLMHLKQMDVEADIANNGMEAINCCKKQRYALVLMDLDMPVLNGFEATAEIRKLEAKMDVHTPIVAVTSFDREGDKEKCLSAGMDEFIPKGAGKARLRELVGKHVFGRAAQQSASAAADERPSGNELKLDMAAIKEQVGTDCEKVVALFFGSVAMLLNCLEFAIDDKDVQAVTHFAYSLKGPCSTMGLLPMSNKAVELVEDANKARWGEALANYKMLCRMLETVRTQSGQGQMAAFPS